MPTEQNQGTTGTGAGMQISGEQIFQETDEGVDTSSSAAQDVQDAFGSASQATEGADATTPASTQVSQVLHGDTSVVTETAKSALGQARETAGQVASQAFGQVQEKAGTAIDQGKQTLSEGLTSIAHGIRQLSETLRVSTNQNRVVTMTADYIEPLAGQVESIAGYLDRKDLNGLTRDLQSFARRNPTLFVASAFGLGLFAVRFFKASPRQELMVRNQNDFSNLDAVSDTGETTTPRGGRRRTSGDATSSGLVDDTGSANTGVAI